MKNLDANISRKNDHDLTHCALYQVFFHESDDAVRVLDNRTLEFLIAHDGSRVGRNGKRQQIPMKNSASVLPLVVGGPQGA